MSFGVSRPEIAMKPAVGMTAAMQAIGVAGSPPPAADKPGSVLQMAAYSLLCKNILISHIFFKITAPKMTSIISIIAW